MRGLLDRQSIAPGEGLLIPKCRSIHTMGMRFPIDVVFVHSDGKVADKATVKPGKLSFSLARGVLEGISVLELPSGTAQSTEVGDQLIFHRL